jgi:hypothetical protein
MHQPFRYLRIKNLRWNLRPIITCTKIEFLHWRKTRQKQAYAFVGKEMPISRIVIAVPNTTVVLLD